MMNNKFIFSIILAVFAIFIFSSNVVLAQEASVVEVNFFYSPTCSHCAAAENFFKDLTRQYPEIKINSYEFSKNIELAQTFYYKYNVPDSMQGYVPLIFTPDRYFVGFDNQIGQEIKGCIEECLLGQEQLGRGVSVPILGQIDIQNFSIPLLAIILGFFDGFNVCSLGALALILGIVITMGSRKKILLFGGGFVLITAIVYWALIFLWHRLFVIMAPHIRSMEIIIGILATIGAWYFLKEFIKLQKRGPSCQFNAVSDTLGGKLQNVFERKTGILATLFAVLIFAVAITVVEFPCSAVLPVVFTGIMAEVGTPFNLSMIYTAIFVLFYMLDEIIVLLVAAFTMQIWIVSGKFMKWINLLATLVMAFFGFYYILWPFIRLLFN